MIRSVVSKERRTCVHTIASTPHAGVSTSSSSHGSREPLYSMIECHNEHPEGKVRKDGKSAFPGKEYVLEDDTRCLVNSAT